MMNRCPDDENIIKDKNFYLYQEYIDLKRWNSYFVQIESSLNICPKSILEIGKGTGFFQDYMKSHRIKVTTLDINKKLKPDIIGDVRNIPLQDNSFDLVICCEVLEHLPFSHFQRALREIKRVSKRYVILSLPYHTFHINLSLKTSGLTTKWFSLRIPLMKNTPNKYHYWEMGKIGYSKNKVRKEIKNIGFKIIEEKTVPLNEYHYFFILEK